jgi:adenine-specific DNA glycosylase
MQGTITVDVIGFCQTVCTAVAPKCATCVLNDVCPSACTPAADRSRVPENTSKNEETYNDNASKVQGNNAKKEEKISSLGWVANVEDATLGGRGN